MMDATSIEQCCLRDSIDGCGQEEAAEFWKISLYFILSTEADSVAVVVVPPW